jgi:hypothetical protein
VGLEDMKTAAGFSGERRASSARHAMIDSRLRIVATFHRIA